MKSDLQLKGKPSNHPSVLVKLMNNENIDLKSVEKLIDVEDSLKLEKNDSEGWLVEDNSMPTKPLINEKLGLRPKEPQSKNNVVMKLLNKGKQVPVISTM